MGGEWASGAALVSETWPAEHRGKALGFMQSAWAIGYGLAAAVTMIVLPRWGWRGVFFVGVLPAFLTFWVRRNVREPELWLRTRGAARGRAAGSATCSATAAPASRSRSRDERVHAVRLVGLQPVAARVSLSMPAASGGIGLSATRDVVVRHRDAGGDVVRLHHVRVHQRRDRPQAHLCRVPGDAPPSSSRLHVAARAAAAARCSDRSSRSSRPATSAASAP